MNYQLRKLNPPNPVEMEQESQPQQVQAPSVFDESISDLFLAEWVLSTLTQRELDILMMIYRGEHSKQICFKLGIAKRTVDIYRHRIACKLHLHSIAEQVILGWHIHNVREFKEMVKGY